MPERKVTDELLHRGALPNASKLIGETEFWRFVEHRIDPLFMKVIRGGTSHPVSSGDATRLSSQELESLRRAYGRGASITVRDIDRVSPLLRRVCQRFERSFSKPVGVRAYAFLTPPVTSGRAEVFPPHYDLIDGLVIQIAGSKRWKVFPPVRPYPLYEERLTAEELAPLTEPLAEGLLEPGDCLLLPRGYVHAVESTSFGSIHVTIGPGFDLVWKNRKELLPNLSPEVRRQLPSRQDFSTEVEWADRALRRVAELLRDEPAGLRTECELLESMDAPPFRPWSGLISG